MPAGGIDVWASVNAYERDIFGNVSPGGDELRTALVDRAFVVGSYFWYVLSLRES